MESGNVWVVFIERPKSATFTEIVETINHHFKENPHSSTRCGTDYIGISQN